VKHGAVKLTISRHLLPQILDSPAATTSAEYYLTSAIGAGITLPERIQMLRLVTEYF
jgi:hypothetical protein